MAFQKAEWVKGNCKARGRKSSGCLVGNELISQDWIIREREKKQGGMSDPSEGKFRRGNLLDEHYGSWPSKNSYLFFFFLLVIFSLTISLCFCLQFFS
jgi:hypothetical protein